MAPNGSDLQQLTDDPAADVSPSWSPDGSRIAFVTGADENTVHQQLFRMRKWGLLEESPRSRSAAIRRTPTKARAKRAERRTH